MPVLSSYRATALSSRTGRFGSGDESNVALISATCTSAPAELSSGDHTGAVRGSSPGTGSPRACSGPTRSALTRNDGSVWSRSARGGCRRGGRRRDRRPLLRSARIDAHRRSMGALTRPSSWISCRPRSLFSRAGTARRAHRAARAEAAGRCRRRRWWWRRPIPPPSVATICAPSSCSTSAARLPRDEMVGAVDRRLVGEADVARCPELRVGRRVGLPLVAP